MVQSRERIKTGRVVSVDGGNRFLKFFTPDGKPQMVRSVIKKIQPWESFDYDDESIGIEIGDDRWIVGQIAADMGGDPVHMGAKSKLTWLLVAATLVPTDDSGVIEVDCLRLLCPDSTNQEFVAAAESIQSLKWATQNGSYAKFKRNGKPVTLTAINRVELVDEGFSAWEYAMQAGWWKQPDKPNFVLSFGGGDVVGVRVIPKRNGGGIVDGNARLSIPGTNLLASMVQAAIQSGWNHTPETSVIMDAIADGSFEIRTIDGAYNFKPAFDVVHPLWIERVWAEVYAKWKGHLATTANGLIIGGSAPLAELLLQKTKGGFSIAHHPEIDNFTQWISAYGLRRG